MKIVRFWAITFCTAALAACETKVDVNLEPVSEPQLRTFTCTIDDNGTKSGIDAAGKTTWEAGDEILIHGEYIGTSDSKLYSTVVTLGAEDISLDGKTATIKFATDEAGLEGIKPYTHADYQTTLYAIYPADVVTAASGYHMYYYNEFSANNSPVMVAYDKDDTFVFTNVCAAIAFTLPADVDFDSYLFTGNDEEVVGFNTYSCRYSLDSTGKPKNNFPYGTIGGSHGPSGPLTQISGDAVCDGTTLNVLYIPMTVGADEKIQFENGFTIKFVKGGDIVKYITTSTDFTLNRNDFLNLGTLPKGNMQTYVDPHVCSLAIENDSYDLYLSNGNKSANCYIVYPSGNGEKVYRFKAVQGNSSTSVGSIASVEVLWETYNDDTSSGSINIIEEVDFDTDYIYFKMPSSPHAGNALIAAKNTIGEILWSWHIWMPTDVVSNADYSDFIGGNMMNMNLGALEAVPVSGEAPIASLGLLYQWGRKDPFVGAREWARYPSKATVTGSSWGKSSVATTIEETIKNPVTYYFTNQNDDGDWNSSPSETLWNDSGSKTIYDPCPPGYKVPQKTGNLWTQTDEGWNIDIENHVIEHTASGVRLPISGFIESYGGSLTGTGYDSKHLEGFFIWSSTNYSTTRANCAHIRTDKTPKYYKAYRGKAYGGSIRCIAE